MINLAGNKNADKIIAEELFLAGIPTIKEQFDGEVPYSIIGELDGWIFRRAWYYYMASCINGLGIPYDIAVKLHEKEYPIISDNYKILGEAVRIDGHCGCPHPKDFKYYSLEMIKQEFSDAKVKGIGAGMDIKWDDKEAQESFDSSWLREFNGVKYIRLYHIDTQIGLNEFVKIIKELETGVN